ncbi:hypothetical protein TWF730_010323 [Orbilia blumenaviensis]|uniref:Prion-inhibition and propagation HeLo domain-containing protein n=1 Tax=Orbilia blumenaviensis TaxID=1796055 RepID=A0AAV9UPG5_9PEZI
MDVTGVAVGIIALYTACRDCYNFFTTVKTAKTESSAYLRDLLIQQSILKAWGFHWQIQNEDGSELENTDRIRQKQTKLHKYLSNNRFKAEGVFSTLSALADTLSNQEKLIKRYGIQLQPTQATQNGPQLTSNVQLTIPNTTIEDVKPVISEIKSRLSVLNKFKWALKDKDNFKKLIAELRSHSESLYRLCPENAFESMNIYLTMECLAWQESPAGLKWTSELATQHAKVDEQSSVREGYKLLASTATLKASVNQNRGGGQVDHKTLTSIDEKQCEMRYLGKGLALFEDEVVYVEMRDYRGPPLELTQEQRLRLHRRSIRAYKRRMASSSGDNSETEDEVFEVGRPADPRLRALIRNFFDTFQGANMMKNVHGLDIAGMIDHTEGEHKGHCSILYRLPSTIGIQSRDRPAGNLRLRAPVTLLSLLGAREKKGIRSTLGKRFELARKLVRAICLLHSSGWLHKNIRAESVIFFPAHVNSLQEDRYDAKIEIDVSEPILMGYIFSRPDDVAVQMNPSTLEVEHITQVSNNSPDRYAGISCDSDCQEPTTCTTMWPEEEHYRRENPRLSSVYGRDMLQKVAVTGGTKVTNISGFTLDYYQHPAKHADQQRLYRHAYDVYSLGILLIEVGLWEKLRNYESPHSYRHPRLRYGDTRDTDYEQYDFVDDHYERRRWICREYMDRLRWECGDTYADVVLSCLMIDSIDNEVATASERELCARIVADLDGCRA